MSNYQQRDILHCDLNNFFASVECAENPEIKDKYVAVSGNAASRHGIILAKNTAAKAMGVQTGEAIWQAKLKCPELVCVPPHYELYVDYSKKVREIYCNYTDKVESFGLDECWLDVTNSKILGTPTEIADKIRLEVKEKTGLTISVGVSFNKPFAKLGSDLKKPDAVTVLSVDNFKEKIYHLKASEMLMVGRKTEARLNAMGIFTIGDLANANEAALVSVFGVNGVRLKSFALGEDCEPVANVDVSRQIKSVGHGTTTLRDMATYKDAEIVINFLSEMVAARLRRYGLIGKVVHLNIRYNDLTHKNKQARVRATFVSGEIGGCANRLLKEIWTPESELPLRSLTVSVCDLDVVACDAQASIFDENNEKKQNLEFSIDKIRKKYGFSAIKKATYLGNDLITDKFCGEDDLLPFKR
jgi:DNA polymerase-4